MTDHRLEGIDLMRQFGSFTASELFCAKCQRSNPVRERLLLALPDGELFEYRCAVCGSSVGERKVRGEIPFTATPQTLRAGGRRARP